MIKKSFFNTAAVFWAIATFAAPYAVHAEQPLCADLVKECLSLTGGERDSCFHGAASDAACANSALGTLISKRSQFSMTTPGHVEQSPAFLGPQVVNRRCVNNFDNSLLAAVIKGNPSSEGITALNISLDECLQSYAPDITRP